MSGQTITSTIGGAGEQDSYTLTAAAGETFTLSFADANAGSGVRPWMQLFSPTGGYLTSDAVNATSQAVEFSYAVPAGGAGTYTALLQDYSGTGTGAYTLEMVKAPGPHGADADGDGGMIASGQTKTGALGRLGDLDAFTLTAAAGETFTLSFADANAGSGVRPWMQLFSPTGGYLTSDAVNANSQAVEFSYAVPAGAGGTYTVLLQDYSGTGTGAYTLEMVKAPGPHGADADGDGGMIASGQTKTGALGRLGDLDAFTLTAAAGETFTLSFADANAGSGVRPWMQLFSPTGGYLTSDAVNANSQAVEFSYAVPAGGAGTYTALLQDYSGTGTGAYTLEMVKAPGPHGADADGDGGALHSGKMVTGTIDRLGDIDAFSFWASGNDSFDVTMSTAGMNSGVRPWFQIFDATGKQVTSSSSSGTNTTISASYSTPSGGAGSYTVVVQDNGLSGLTPGNYTVRLTGNLLLTAAVLSRDVYGRPAERTGDLTELFSPLESDWQFFDFGYRAQAYRDGGDYQIVLAFEGTRPLRDLLDVPNLLADLVADSSIVTGVATSALVQQVTNAAKFVRQIQTSYPGRKIVLTGHSLGGGIAQVVGKVLNLKTLAFNAPGTYYVYPELSQAIADIGTPGNDSTNRNYRIYGDPVSAAGTQLATVLTLTEPESFPVNPLDSIVRAVNFFSRYGRVHSMHTVISQIQNNAILKPSGTPEPFDIALIQAAVVATRRITGPIAGQFSHAYSFVTTAAERLIEGVSGKMFTLSGDTSSPAMSSLLLPDVAGVTSYTVRYLVGTTWSVPQTVVTGTRFSPATAARAFEFKPLNSAGQDVRIDGPFLFAARFATAGTFNGTLAGDPSFTVPAWLTLSPDADVSLTDNTLNVAYGTATISIDLATSFPGMAVAVSGTSGVTFNASQHLGSLTIEDAGSVTIASGGSRFISTTGLSISQAARLDLNDNDLILDYGGTAPQAALVRDLIKSGRANGSWTGAGLVSTAAKNNTTASTTLGYMEATDYKNFYGQNAKFDGESLDSTAVVVRYTLYGDANLDRAVGAADFNLLASNFGKPSRTWSNGDFDYDGDADGADFNLLASKFGTTLPLAVSNLSGSITPTPTPPPAVVPQPAPKAGNRRGGSPVIIAPPVVASSRIKSAASLQSVSWGTNLISDQLDSLPSADVRKGS